MPASRNGIGVRREGRAKRARSLAAPTVRRWAAHMLGALELAGAELSIVLCDDAFIHDLNQRFAGEDHATDVLAFASREAPGPRRGGRAGSAGAPLGDVVISLETAARQARARGATLEDEVRLLLAHGLLHLVGYDHRTRAQERIMTARTQELLSAVPARSRA